MAGVGHLINRMPERLDTANLFVGSGAREDVFRVHELAQGK